MNRTTSQSSYRTLASTSASIKAANPSLHTPTVIRLPDFPPPSPAAGSNWDGDELFLEPMTFERSISITISACGSSESLHAESFVTAIETIQEEGRFTDIPLEAPEPAHTPQSVTPVSETFISTRWDRDTTFGPGGAVKLKSKRQWLSSTTPAFWAFWLGFLCFALAPIVWWIGGWHFTRFGEQPPRVPVWDFYFKGAYWREKLCCCFTRQKDRKPRPSHPAPPLPRWVEQKLGLDETMARLEDPSRSLSGISFGYPFIPRPLDAPSPDTGVLHRVSCVLDPVHRLLDKLIPDLSLRKVKGRRETARRMIDPWIQRCRYAVCDSFIFFWLVLIAFTIWYLCILHSPPGWLRG